MNCWDIERLIDAHLDNELSGVLRVEFDAHRLQCSVCERKVALMEACSHVVRHDVPRTRLARDFTDRVMAAVAAQPRRADAPSRRWSRSIKIGAAAALQAAAALAFLFLWPFRSPNATDGTTPGIPSGLSASADWARGPTVDLYESVWSSLDRFSAARSNVANDFISAAYFVRGLGFPRELAELPALNPFQALQTLLLPPQNDEPAVEHSDPNHFSL